MLSVISSPFFPKVGASETLRRNIAYSRFALADSLQRGESPVSPNLMFPQVWASAPNLKAAAHVAVVNWLQLTECEELHVYVDLGIDTEMHSTIKTAKLFDLRVIERRIFEGVTTGEMLEALDNEKLLTLDDLVESVRVAERLTA